MSFFVGPVGYDRAPCHHLNQDRRQSLMLELRRQDDRAQLLEHISRLPKAHRRHLQPKGFSRDQGSSSSDPGVHSVRHHALAPQVPLDSPSLPHLVFQRLR